jgi:predicted RNase H-related nuclease YkuK (DUF458 family)
MPRPKIDIEECRKFINNSSESSKIYIGCDSVIFKRAGKWFSDYVVVVVIHKDGKHGCKIFGELTTEPDYSHDKTKPTMRLLNEAYKTVALYEELKDSIGTRYREIHLDINSNEKHNSHLALSQAAGYIRGICGFDPKIKPEAFAASYCADRFMRVKNYDITKLDETNEKKRPKRKYPGRVRSKRRNKVGQTRTS